MQRAGHSPGAAGLTVLSRSEGVKGESCGQSPGPWRVTRGTGIGQGLCPRGPAPQWFSEEPSMPKRASCQAEMKEPEGVSWHTVRWGDPANGGSSPRIPH